MTNPNDPGVIIAKTRRAKSAATTLMDAFRQLMRAGLGTEKLDFRQIAEAFDTLKKCTWDIGYAPLVDLVEQFDLLVLRESMRCEMKLKALDRTAQMIPFFIATCQRISIAIDSLSQLPQINTEQNQKASRRKRRVLIVDDSKMFQILLTKVCARHTELEVVAVASDASEAQTLIEQFHPDVVTLDVHMPGMDGFTFLRELMKKYPIPVIMISSLSVDSGNDVFNALYQGAIDFVHKGGVTLSESSGPIIADRIYKTSMSSLESLMQYYTNAPSLLQPPRLDLERVVAIKASVGSTRTLIDVLRLFPKKIPPILISQNILPGFSKLLIRHLNEVCPFAVKEAEEGELIEPMKVLITPDQKQITVVQTDKGYRVALTDAGDSQENSVSDGLFDSVAACYGAKAIGILLPGSGADGAQGLLEIKRAGGHTIVQDEFSCPDPSLSREAVRIEAANDSISADTVGEALISVLSKGGKAELVVKSNDENSFAAQGIKVLIVDDSPTIRTLVRYHLRAIGIEDCVETKDGLEAWKILLNAEKETKPFSLVICDQHMPEMEGLELLQKLRADDRFKKLPFVLLTAESGRETVVKAIQGGSSDFIVKPASAQIMAQKVKSILSKKNTPSRTS